MEEVMRINTREFRIIERINKFVVKVSDGKRSYLAHTGNTGRLENLLVPGKKCYCTNHRGKTTQLKLIAVEDNKYNALIEPSIHEKSFELLVNNGRIPWITSKIIGRNVSINGRRIDFLLENRTLVELKSALGRTGDHSFYPDTRSRRGEEHIKLVCERNGILVFISGIFVKGIVPGNVYVYELLKSCNGLIKGIGLVFWDDRVWIYSKNLPVLLRKPEDSLKKE